MCLTRSCGVYINIRNYSGSCCSASSHSSHRSHTPSPHFTPTPTTTILPALPSYWPHTTYFPSLCAPCNAHTAAGHVPQTPAKQKALLSWSTEIQVLPGRTGWVCQNSWSFGSALPDLNITSRNWTLLRAHDIYQIWFQWAKGFKCIRAQKHRLMGRGYNHRRLSP